ncbi:MAG: AAA family ATPase [Planctomycetota bacterium]
MELSSRFFNPPDQSYYLFGPRGTGKSTWVKQRYPDALVVDLLDPEAYRMFSSRPERLRERIRAESPRIVIVDEVQKVPEILPVVHQLLESENAPRFVLTGSSARKLRRTGVDLLAGRAVLASLHPFMAAERGAGFQLDRALETGLIPLVMNAPDPVRTLQAYVTLYLREEVQAEGLLRNIGQFARFLEAASFSHAAVLNTAEVARDCQVDRKTVEGYLQVLEDLLLSFRVPVFTRRAKRHLVRHPKFFFFDAGVFRTIRPSGPLDRPSERDGAALEGLVAQHLRAWIAYRGRPHDLCYWRTKSGIEVDFVVYGPDGLWAIEVQNAAVVRSSDPRPLAAFREDYPEARVALLYRGRERLMIGGISCLPVEDFLRDLTPDGPIV